MNVYRRILAVLAALILCFSMSASAWAADTAAAEPVEAEESSDEISFEGKSWDEIMDELLGMLSQRQQKILRLRFGMEDGKCHSLEEIGSMLGISKERARQIEKQSMEKLQKLGAGMGLEDFLNDTD